MRALYFVLKAIKKLSVELCSSIQLCGPKQFIQFLVGRGSHLIPQVQIKDP